MKQLSVALLVFFMAFTANAQSKIGIVDAEYILNQMPEFTEVQEGLDNYNKELQASLQKNIQEYEKLVKDYQDTNTTIGEEVKKQKESKIVELENSIKGFRQKASVMMQMRQNELTGPLYDKIDAAMKQVIEEENYTQIFHAGASGLAFSRVEDDITDKVLTKLGIEIPQEEAAQTGNK